MDDLIHPAIASAADAASILDVAAALGDALISAEPVGSRVTCDPAPVGTDEDWLMLLEGPRVLKLFAKTKDPFETLRSLGFVQDGSPEFYTGMNEGGFRSWRRGDVNVVTTQSLEFYDRFLTATILAKRFNLLVKADRIALFQAVLYGVRHGMLEQRDASADGEAHEVVDLLDMGSVDVAALEPFSFLREEDGDVDSMIGRRQVVVSGMDEIRLHALDDLNFERDPILVMAVPEEGVEMGDIETEALKAQSADAEKRGIAFHNWGDWVVDTIGRRVRLRMTDVTEDPSSA